METTTNNIIASAIAGKFRVIFNAEPLVVRSQGSFRHRNEGVHRHY
jgi:hypothetical protein